MEKAEAKEEDCEGLVNYALSIGDVEVAMFFREQPDGRYRISLRSKGQVNVAAIAGIIRRRRVHACASGCSLDGPLTVAVNRVLARLSSRCPADSEFMKWRSLEESGELQRHPTAARDFCGAQSTHRPVRSARHASHP